MYLCNLKKDPSRRSKNTFNSKVIKNEISLFRPTKNICTINFDIFLNLYISILIEILLLIYFDDIKMCIQSVLLLT